MKKRILLGVAWPYASGHRHIGHAAGAYIPADIFARYHRSLGNDVLMVSGSDEHGTPITIAADRAGVSPEEIIRTNHANIKQSFQDLRISFDLYTETHTENHAEVTQKFFLRLMERGYLFLDRTVQPYDPQANRFLPDRYVEGTCPHCGYGDARGDQCDNCGRTLDPADLVNPRSKLSGAPPEFRETEHFFLDLPKLAPALQEWLDSREGWRPHVINFARSVTREGLIPRAITRDIDWGVPIPLPGYEGKRIYVWFDAVIGYLSASVEWAALQGDPDRWKAWWETEEGDASVEAYYFVGKDNIPFHAIFWPAMLIGHGGLALPTEVPANAYLTMQDQKISTSRNYAVWLPDILSRYDVDAVRYFLTRNAPEQRDTNFTWPEFFRRVNDELVATFGNLVHRVLTFTYRNFEGRVPAPGALGEAEREVLAECEAAFRTVGELIEGVRLKDALAEVMRVAQRANGYLDHAAPWKQIKQDRDAAGTSLWVALQVIAALRTLSQPFMPDSAQRLHELLGGSGQAAELPWSHAPLEAGVALREPAPLFAKLTDEQLEAELAA